MNILSLISAKFIPENEMADAFRSIAAEQKLNFSDGASHDFCVSAPNYGPMFEIALESAESFKEKNEANTFVDGYGPLMSFWYNDNGLEEDTIIVPFLRAFLERYPDVLIFNEESSYGTLVFNLSQIKAYPGNSADEFLFTKPHESVS